MWFMFRQSEREQQHCRRNPVDVQLPTFVFNADGNTIAVTVQRESASGLVLGNLVYLLPSSCRRPKGNPYE